MTSVKHSHWLAAAIISLIVSALPVNAADSDGEMGLMQESKPLVTRAGAWHTWSDHIHIKPGQEKLRTILTLTNGAEGRPKATDLKVTLNRQPLGTIQDFKGGDSASYDLTGKLPVGSTAFAVQGLGANGAWIKWQLHIERPVVSSVSPNPLNPADTISIKGKNFSDHAASVLVYIGNKTAKTVSSTNQEVKFKLTPQVMSGNQQLQVVVHSVRSAPFNVSVRATPHITFVNMLASPPHQPVTLSGTGFSPVASENVVMFGTHKAEVQSATEGSISCLVPEMHFPQWHVPIKVIINGVSSHDKVFIHVDMRVVDNQGIPMH